MSARGRAASDAPWATSCKCCHRCARWRVRVQRALAARARRIRAMCALSAWSARAALSAGLSRPSGSTSRSNLARKALRAAWVRADRSDVLAHEVCAPRRPRSAAELLTKARRRSTLRPAPQVTSRWSGNGAPGNSRERRTSPELRGHDRNVPASVAAAVLVPVAPLVEGLRKEP
jgi:hypothetical protein